MILSWNEWDDATGSIGELQQYIVDGRSRI